MSKRFTETDKWSDPWYLRLPPEAKLFWAYINDRCDQSGVISMEWGLASYCIGFQVNESILEHFQDQIVVLYKDKFWIKGHIQFQYPRLSRECKPHKPVFDLIEKHGLISKIIGSEQGKTENTLPIPNRKASKAFPEGIEYLQEKEKEKDKEKDREKEGCGEKEGFPDGIESSLTLETEPLTLKPRKEPEAFPDVPQSLRVPEFLELWDDWFMERKKQKHPMTPKAAKLQLKECEQWGVNKAIEAIQTSIKNGYRGLFEPKPTAPNGTYQPNRQPHRNDFIYQ